MKIRSIMSLGLIIAVTLAPGAAAAAGPEITVAPFLQNVRVGGGPSVNFKVNYTNGSSQTQQLALSIADFGSLDQSGGVAFAGNQPLNKYSLSPWLKLSASSLTLQPHHKGSVTATIVNDPSMGPGGHYAAIVATLVGGPGAGRNDISLQQKISSLVFAIKTGGEKYDISLQQIDHNGNLFKLPNEAYLTIRATGNVHVVPRGIVYLKDHGNKIISKGIINQESGYVLPGTTRVFTIELDRLASPGFFRSSYYLQANYRYEGD